MFGTRDRRRHHCRRLGLIASRNIETDLYVPHLIECGFADVNNCSSYFKKPSNIIYICNHLRSTHTHRIIASLSRSCRYVTDNTHAINATICSLSGLQYLPAVLRVLCSAFANVLLILSLIVYVYMCSRAAHAREYNRDTMCVVLSVCFGVLECVCKIALHGLLFN